MADLYKEPCVGDYYLDFSTVPFSDIGYCEKSVCDEDWFYDQLYCDEEVGFDKDVCDDKIKELNRFASSYCILITTSDDRNAVCLTVLVDRYLVVMDMNKKFARGSTPHRKSFWISAFQQLQWRT